MKRNPLRSLETIAGYLRRGVELNRIDANLLGKALYQIAQEISGEDLGIREDYVKLTLEMLKQKTEATK